MPVITEEQLQQMRKLPFWDLAVQREMERNGAGIQFLVRMYNAGHDKKISLLRLVGGTDVEA